MAYNALPLGQQIEPQDLIKFGLIPELIGRMPVITALASLMNKLWLRFWQSLKTHWSSSIKSCLIWKACSLKSSPRRCKPLHKRRWSAKRARGLRSIMERALLDTMFDLPNQSNVEKVVVDESSINADKPPVLVYRNQEKQAWIAGLNNGLDGRSLIFTQS